MLLPLLSVYFCKRLNCSYCNQARRKIPGQLLAEKRRFLILPDFFVKNLPFFNPLFDLFPNYFTEKTPDHGRKFTKSKPVPGTCEHNASWRILIDPNEIANLTNAGS
jgi:hypothetical protein